jgi:hypothetical protein
MRYNDRVLVEEVSTRTWFIKAFASIVMMGLSSGQGNAEPSLTEILRDYDNPGLSVAQRMMIVSNLASTEKAFGWANTALRAQRMRRRALYCVPDNLTIEPHELIDMLRDALWDEPRLGDTPIGFALLVTLQRGFPCK